MKGRGFQDFLFHHLFDPLPSLFSYVRYNNKNNNKDGDQSTKKITNEKEQDLHSNSAGFGSNSDEPLNRIVSQGGWLMREAMAGRLRIMFVYTIN